MYENPSYSNKFIVESKLEKNPPERDLVFDSVGDYQDNWNQLKYLFQNIDKCGDPYRKYLNDLKKFYAKQKYMKSRPVTTAPLYVRESFIGGADTATGDSQDVTAVNPDNKIIQSPRMSVTQLMKPNVPTGNEQIDTSVKPADDHLPIVYTDKNIQLLKQETMDANFEQQREAQKQIYQMKYEIDHLKGEISALRGQLVNEKANFEDLDQSIEEKTQQIIDANKINVDLNQKIDELNKKNEDIENMYLSTDARRNTLAVRLKTIRKSLEEDVKNKGYTYIPPTHWTMNQWRPPNCLPRSNTVPSPVSDRLGSYAEIFGQTTVKSVPLYRYVEGPIDPIDANSKEYQFTDKEINESVVTQVK